MLRGLVLLCGLLPLSVTSCSQRHFPDGLHVSCSHGRLTSLPVTWVGDVVWLDVSHNQLSELPDLSHPSLSHLRQLNVSHNAIKRLDRHALRGLSRLRSVDLSYNQLHAIGSDTFSGPSSLDALLLDHNGLTRVDDNAFLGLSGLRSLGLDSNHLSSLSPRTFRGLASLTALDVSHNALGPQLRNDTFRALVRLRSLQLHHNGLQRLEPAALSGLSSLTEVNLNSNQLQLLHSSLPAGVFAPLTSVEWFSLSDNSQVDVEEFPGGVFSDLVSVKHFVIDSFRQVHFGPEFASLSLIHTLDLGKSCRASKISNDTLLGFQNSTLHTLVLRHCRLLDVETCAFCSLPHLKHLDLSYNYYLRPSVALASLYGLQGQSMEEINMTRIGQRIPEYHSLDRESSRYLRNICVKRFNIAYSHLLRWASNALSDTPDTQFAGCIRDLDASENHLIGDVTAFLRALMFFPNLTSLRLQDQKVCSMRRSACVLGSGVKCGHMASRPPLTATWNIATPTTLTFLNMSSVTCYFNSPPLRVNFSNAQGLRTLDISYGAMSHCLTTFFGLDHLETLDLSGNYCNNISDTIFDYLPSLRHLSLSASHLQPGVVATRARRILRELQWLETLDLSRNWLTELQGHGLPAQTRLRQLILSYNSFQTIPIHIGLHPHLAVLDLSFNALTSLTSSEQQSLDRQGTRRQFRLKLRGNPLLCACSNMYFLHWLWNTPVLLDGEGSSTRRYPCTSETGETTDTERVMAHWKAQWRRCVGQRVFGLALSAFLLQLLGLVTTYLVMRHWTHFRYVWYVLQRLRLPLRHDFRKDAYVVYADADAEMARVKLPGCLEPHGVRLLLGHRDAGPGWAVAQNILQDMQDSWKVVLLVTPAFAACRWACFMVQLAQRSIMDTHPDRVLVVLLEDPRHLPPSASLQRLLRHCPQSNVLHVPPDAPSRHPAWQRLATAILGRKTSDVTDYRHTGEKNQ